MKTALLTIGLVIILIMIGQIEIQGNELTNNVKELANQGDAKAQLKLGIMYEKGQGVKRDYTKALYWFEQSANNKNERAQLKLGVVYKYGRGIKKDYKKALYWLEQSAKQGNSEAQLELGDMYLNRRDYEKALHWLEQSAKQGNRVAEQRLNKIANENTKRRLKLSKKYK